MIWMRKTLVGYAVVYLLVFLGTGGSFAAGAAAEQHLGHDSAMPSAVSAYPGISLPRSYFVGASVQATANGSPTTNKTLSANHYGAKCDGVTDDTAAFRLAAQAAGAFFTSSGRPATIAYDGKCVIAGQVTFGSGVHWLGSGTIIVPKQTTVTFFALNADDVALDHVNIDVITPGTAGPYNSAIFYGVTRSDAVKHARVAIRDCHVSNSNWGISVFYSGGATGSLSDVDIERNVVTSALPYTNGDGIHVGGRVSQVLIAGNLVVDRSDAAIALTSESNIYQLSGAIIRDNRLLRDRVGIDISGASNVSVTGNFVQASAPTDTSNPAFRQIAYGGYIPVNIETVGNYFEHGVGRDYAAKIDDAGNPPYPPLHSVFKGNTVAGLLALYVNGSSVAIADNSFTTLGGTLYIDYDGKNGVPTHDVTIGTNHWTGDGAVFIGANSSLIKNVVMAPQITPGKIVVTNGANLTRMKQ